MLIVAIDKLLPMYLVIAEIKISQTKRVKLPREVRKRLLITGLIILTNCVQHNSLVWCYEQHSPQPPQQNHQNEQQNHWTGSRTIEQHPQQKDKNERIANSLRYHTHTAQPIQAFPYRYRSLSLKTKQDMSSFVPTSIRLMNS